MKKHLKILLLIVLASVLSIGFVACNPKALTMPEIFYDDTTKVVSWEKGQNAVGYSLKVNGVEKPSTSITQVGNQMQYIMDEAESGTYTITVVAKGDGKKFSNSAPKTKTIDYTNTFKLSVGEISYNDDFKIVFWDIVPNATGYVFKIDGSDKSANLVVSGGRVQYTITDTNYGVRTLTVVAKGDDNLYLNSDVRSKKITYTQAIKLQMPEISYSDFSKVVSWSRVSGASGYTFTFNASDRSAFLVDDGTKIKYTVNEANDGAYTVTVVAKGDGMYFKDSDPKTFVVNYTAAASELTLREHMMQSLVSFSEYQGILEYAAHIGGSIEIPGFTDIDFATIMGNEPLTAGDIYFTSEEIYLLLDGNMMGEGQKSYLVLPNLLTMMFGELVTELPQAAVDSETATGYKLEMEIESMDEAIKAEALAFLNDNIGAVLSDLPIPIITINSVEFTDITNPVFTIEFDDSMNVVGMSIDLSIVGNVNALVLISNMNLPLSLTLSLGIIPSDRPLPADPLKYLEDEGYTPIELDGIMPPV